MQLSGDAKRAVPQNQGLQIISHYRIVAHTLQADSLFYLMFCCFRYQLPYI